VELLYVHFFALMRLFGRKEDLTRIDLNLVSKLLARMEI
jgi:hypothetical protein